MSAVHWAGPYCFAQTATGAKLDWDPLADRRPPRGAAKFVVRWRVTGFDNPRKRTFADSAAAEDWARRIEAARMLRSATPAAGRSTQRRPPSTTRFPAARRTRPHPRRTRSRPRRSLEPARRRLTSSATCSAPRRLSRCRRRTDSRPAGQSPAYTPPEFRLAATSPATSTS
jgi:hypothetical protein